MKPSRASFLLPLLFLAVLVCTNLACTGTPDRSDAADPDDALALDVREPIPDEEGASDGAGVQAVRSDSVVDSQYSDDEVARGVRMVFDGDRDLSRYAISIDVVDGIVNLEGIVATSYQRKRATTLARWAAGVRGVSNNLTFSRR